MRALVLFLALVSCSGGTAALEPSSSYRVLFIGNSLTYFNDLPGTVSQLASSVNETVEVASVARPNLALIDHVNGKSNAVEVIQTGDWDYVVLQQGPSSLDLSRDTLILATRLLDPYIRAAGGRSALLMVWPESSRFEFFDEVRVSYQLAAQEVDGLFLPAGEAWLAAWAVDPQVALYGPDGYHPSELGTYLALYHCLAGLGDGAVHLLGDRVDAIRKVGAMIPLEVSSVPARGAGDRCVTPVSAQSGEGGGSPLQATAYLNGAGNEQNA